MVHPLALQKQNAPVSALPDVPSTVLSNRFDWCRWSSLSPLSSSNSMDAFHRMGQTHESPKAWFIDPATRRMRVYLLGWQP
jgi:hypothetical protein